MSAGAAYAWARSERGDWLERSQGLPERRLAPAESEL